MSRIKLLLLFVLMVSLFTSCEKDDSSTGRYEYGAIVLNEGAYNNANASVSFYKYGSSAVKNDIFNLTNGRSIGDVLQGATIDNAKIYMVLNGSGKVEVANSDNFEQLYTIEGLTNPRNATVVNDKLYVTQWGGYGENGSVKVYSITDYSLVTTITLGSGCEGIVYADGKIYVANSGGYGLDNTISVISATTNTVENTINVGDCPKEMVVDKNGDIWAICSGYIEYDASWNIASQSSSELVKISGTDVERIVLFQDQHPSHIDINSTGDVVYYGAGYGFSGIYKLAIDSRTLSSSPFVDGSFYGFNVNPNNDDIYVLLAPNFSSAGSLEIYSEGVKQSEFSVGIGPSTVLFN
ncbi:MAG: DUF5074 domain-containing protein [Bacteroidales bacterium]